MRKNATKTLLLHVGLPKTGTTALQWWLRQQGASLSSLDVSYASDYCGKGHKHSFLVRELRRGHCRTLKRVLRDNRSETLVLSNEGLSNHFYDFGEPALAAFREQTAEIRVRIILVVREETSWLKSYHKQCVLNPNNGASDLWATALRADELREHPRVKQLLDHETLTSDMTNALGAEDVVSLTYDEGLFSAFLGSLGLGTLRSDPLPRVNESIPDWVVELVRRVNQRRLSEAERIRWIAALQRYLGSNHTIMTGSLRGSWRRHSSALDLSILEGRNGLLDQAEDDEQQRAIAKFADFVAAEQSVSGR